MAEDGDGGWRWRMMMEDGDGGWWKIFYSTLVCKQGRPLTVVVDLWWPECTNPAPMLCTKTTRSSCLLLPLQGMACGWLDTLRLILESSKFYLLWSVPKVTVAALPIEWTHKVECWNIENHFKQVKLKLKLKTVHTVVMVQSNVIGWLFFSILCVLLTMKMQSCVMWTSKPYETQQYTK